MFRRSIRAALANPNLQAALDANSERRLNVRSEAFASLPQPWESMRRRAHAMRVVVIAYLDELLAQFVERLETNGITILHAADGPQVISYILDIARQNNAHLIAKSKTMISEEIGLNHAMEAAGLEVIETDLGEYIVQLRGERPSHIITPAVHLRRAEVGETFHEKLGLPFSEDILTLTSAARRVLRQVFLDADIGISGVNFGVVESGTLCLVTNEGNGRMVTTLPKVHIALMGIERLVPTLDDLALMLYLLPRSATGQKLSVYTSLIHSPARSSDEIGPQKRYLILVDNGRSAMRNSPLAEALYCIRCGACLNACPVFREIGGHAYVNPRGESSSYPGPIGSVVSPGLFGGDEFGHLARASSLCGACREVCPVDIDLPKLLLRVRAGETGRNSRVFDRRAQSGREKAATPNAPALLTLALGVFAWVASSPARFTLAQRAFGVFSRKISPTSDWMRLPAFTGWGYSRDFPRPGIGSFHERWKRLQFEGAGEKKGEGVPVAHTPVEAGSARARLPDAVGERIGRFEQELNKLGGAFKRCPVKELPGQILDILRQRGINSIVTWSEEFYPKDLLETLRQAKITLSQEPDPTVRAGLTGASLAIAETGSVLVCGGRGRPLTASLLPELHIVLLHEEDIVDNLAQALNLQELREASSAALITGPSRTADIEMTLTIGVHGPGELIVFCLSDI